MATGTLTTNLVGTSTAELALTTETMVTLIVKPVASDIDNYKICIEVSPDGGTTWIDTNISVTGKGTVTWIGAATKARATVKANKSDNSTATVWILAR